MSYYDYDRIAAGDKNKEVKDPAKFQYTPFYRVARVQVLGKTDFVGDITSALRWEAGYHLSYFKEGEIDRENINKGKEDFNRFPDNAVTLFELYRKCGFISDEEAGGGLTSSVRLGLTYDTRDKEGAPSRGVWAEGHVTAAPRWLGTSIPHYRYSFTLRQYFPVVKNDVLTLAYRLNYEGPIGNNAPYYVLPYMTVMGDYYDRDGMGGYRTVRGLMRARVVGLDMAAYNAELRWRFARFQMLNQNIALGLSAFSDGAMVTRGRDMKPYFRQAYPVIFNKEKDSPHITVGAGFRFIMNENFIVAVEYGTPVSRFVDKSNPIYGQDGTGALYINTGYLF
jgi:outer membrane protein assembly factor BamA